MANHLLNDSNVRIDPATENKQDTIVTALGKSVATPESVIYDGEGVTATDLQVNQAACALLNTASHEAEIISVGENNVLDLWITNAAKSETVTLSLREHSAAAPALANLIRAIAVATGADQAQTVDRSCVGLDTGTVHYCKTPVRVAVTPGSFIVLAAIEDITGPAYCRYQLRTA